jgi:hypothetical protein
MPHYQWTFDTPAAQAAKTAEWQQRDWPAWLKAHLKFPFEAMRTREEDADDGFTTLRNPFPVGSRLTVMGLADPPMNDYDGVVVKVQRGSNKGEAPLADLEASPANDPNYGPVQEFVVHWTSRE